MAVTIFSWFLIPATAFLAAGNDWFSTNFSVTGAVFPGSLFLVLWAFFTGGYFRFLIRRAAFLASPFLPSARETKGADLALLLLALSVFLPYRPEESGWISAVHVALAFSATVLFYLSITSLDLKLYFLYPEVFSLSTGLLGFAIAATGALLILSGFMISSALEFFLTVFAGLWLDLLCRRLLMLKRHWL